MTEFAYAKLNISLDVLGLRPDGYHDMLMVMQSISLCDDVDVRLTDSGVIRCETDNCFLPGDERNIAVKAARVFFSAADIPGLGADISIKKRIPIGAGMAGGSSDGSAVLRALNRLTGAGFSVKELEKLGEKLGSDVPFCVAGGTALAEGRGEILTQVSSMPDCGIVVCKPEFSISTPELFAKIDSRAGKCRPDTDGILKALDDSDLKGVARRMYNVFEDVLPRKYNDIYRLKGLLLDSGALGTAMTGTGSAVFGIFETPGAADAAMKALSGSCDRCFSARPVRIFPE